MTGMGFARYPAPEACQALLSMHALDVLPFSCFSLPCSARVIVGRMYTVLLHHSDTNSPVLESPLLNPVQ